MINRASTVQISRAGMYGKHYVCKVDFLLSAITCISLLNRTITYKTVLWVWPGVLFTQYFFCKVSSWELKKCPHTLTKYYTYNGGLAKILLNKDTEYAECQACCPVVWIRSPTPPSQASVAPSLGQEGATGNKLCCSANYNPCTNKEVPSLDAFTGIPYHT